MNTTSCYRVSRPTERPMQERASRTPAGPGHLPLLSVSAYPGPGLGGTGRISQLILTDIRNQMMVHPAMMGRYDFVGYRRCYRSKIILFFP